MAGFSLSAVVGNRVDKKDENDNGSGKLIISADFGLFKIQSLN